MASTTAAATEDRAALNMDELTAPVAGIIAPYAPTQLHAGLFSSQHRYFGLEAVFSRYRTQPRGKVMVAAFGGPFTRQDDKKTAQARAWRFRTRTDLVDMLTQGVTWTQRAYFLVFWHHDGYFPPARVDVHPQGAGTIPNNDDPSSARMRVNAAFADAPISFSNYMDWAAEGGLQAEEEAAVVVVLGGEEPSVQLRGWRVP